MTYLGELEHGSDAEYGAGCRCEYCCQAHRVYNAELRAKRMAERVLVNGRLVHPKPKHGTTNGYFHYGCRCVDCTAARTAAQKRVAA